MWMEAKLDIWVTKPTYPFKQTSPGTNYTDSRFTFIRKPNKKRDVTRYRARLVAKGYTHRLGRDYDLTYSAVMDVITYRYHCLLYTK